MFPMSYRHPYVRFTLSAKSALPDELRFARPDIVRCRLAQNLHVQNTWMYRPFLLRNSAEFAAMDI